MFLYIGGIPGVGKSTIIRSLEIKAAKENIKVEKMAGTPILCKLAGLKTAEALRRLSEEKREKLRPRMYDIIHETLRQKPDTLWIFDGHFCYFDWNGKEFGTRPIQSWDKELMMGIIVLTARPETILSRRMKDRRPDRKLSLDFIKKEIKKEAEIAKLQAETLEKPLIFIANEDGKAGENAEKILQLIKKKKARSCLA